MPAQIDEVVCEACEVCISLCPEKALVRRGGRMVVVEVFCRSCGLCEDNCPAGAISVRGDG